VALVANLASRFGVGFSVWHDLLLMLADGQIGASLAILGAVIAGVGVAILALGRRPGRPSAELPIDGEIFVRRQGHPAEPEPSGEIPEEDEALEPDAPEPAQSEPERDPRLWSKPRGWISPPPGSRSATPWPFVA
jgi:hypothetical protein